MTPQHPPRRLRLLLCLVPMLCLVAACKTGGAPAAHPGKWLTPPERANLREQQLRRDLGIEGREAVSNSPADTGEVWFTSEITRYNAHGAPTLSQELDQDAKVVRETRYEYQDTLLMRYVVQEASGYSSAMSYRYGPGGAKTDEWMLQRGDTTLHRTYQLDAHGNEVEVGLRRYRDGVQLRLLTRRDSLGRPVEVTETQGATTNWKETYVITDSLWKIHRVDGNQKVQADFQMRFDKHGFLVAMINRDDEGQVRMRVDYQNDKEGRVTQERHFAAGGREMQTVTYRYDKRGLLTERRVSTPAQAFQLTTRYTYTERQGASRN